MMRCLNAIDSVINSLMFIIIAVVLPFWSLRGLLLLLIEINVLQNNWFLTSGIWSDFILLFNHYDILIFDAAHYRRIMLAQCRRKGLVKRLSCFYVCNEFLDILLVVGLVLTGKTRLFLDVGELVNTFLLKLGSVVAGEKVGVDELWRHKEFPAISYFFFLKSIATRHHIKS